jgi:Flp pilus assembly pilin Flp
MELLDRLYISAQSRLWRAKDKVKEFMDSQDGVSNVVATIIILLIVVLLIGVFWDRLKTFVGDMMDKIFNTEFTDSGL